MKRSGRLLAGAVVTKVAVATDWYLVQKSMEKENDWKTEGKEGAKETGETKRKPTSTLGTKVDSTGITSGANSKERAPTSTVADSVAKLSSKIVKVSQSVAEKSAKTKPAVKKPAVKKSPSKKVVAKKVAQTPKDEGQKT